MRLLLAMAIAICLLTGYMIPLYRPVQNLSSVGFTVKYLGVEMTGTVAGLRGDITWGDCSALADCKFDVLVDVSTIQTGIELRDNHLRGKEFLDAVDHPYIRFTSNKVEATNDKGQFTMHGDLTIKGHTKEISFPFTVAPIDNGYVFKGSFQVNRKDFEVGNSVVISDHVTVTLNVSAIQ
jgi:polyisoprenoid-binding protein YceI